MKIKRRSIIAFLSLLIFPGLISCAPEKALMPVKDSLPQAELSLYNDSFDKPRGDLWDRAGYLFHEGQLRNFKQADMRLDNGKLIIHTKTGSFSKGGLSSRYFLKGDFDIRLTCRFNFIKGIPGMDQLFNISVVDPDKNIDGINAVGIGLSMRAESNDGHLFSYCSINGNDRHSESTGNFNGALRILRNGKYISTLYKLNRAADWSHHRTYHATDKDVLVGFILANFFMNRTDIRAEHSISAEIDSFVIAAAQGIIEEEI